MVRIDDHGRDDAALEPYFAAARAAAPVLSATLMARMLADADRVLARHPAPLPAFKPQAGSAPGVLRAALAALGGWGAVAGLTTATLAGVWIGFSGAAGDVGALVWGASDSLGVVELIPGEAEIYAVGFGLEG